jgi:hypothetical protein
MATSVREDADFRIVPSLGRRDQNRDFGQPQLPSTANAPGAKWIFNSKATNCVGSNRIPQQLLLVAIGTRRKEGHAISQWMALHCRCGRWKTLRLGLSDSQQQVFAGPSVSCPISIPNRSLQCHPRLVTCPTKRMSRETFSPSLGGDVDVVTGIQPRLILGGVLVLAAVPPKHSSGHAKPVDCPNPTVS